VSGHRRNPQGGDEIAGEIEDKAVLDATSHRREAVGRCTAPQTSQAPALWVMSRITLSKVWPSYGLPGSAFIWATTWSPLQVLEGGGNAELDAKLVIPMSVALADTFTSRTCRE
jgi:hypothetical protein